MNLRNGNSLWIDKNEIKNIYPYLYEDIKCDVLVVGAGITGGIMSFYLSKAGFKTIIVDKNIIGYGSTAVTTAILEYQIDSDISFLSKIIGIQNANKCFKYCSDAIKEIKEICKTIGNNCSFKNKESIYFSDKFLERRYLNKENELRNRAGFNSEFSEEISLFNCKGAISTKYEGADIDPYLFTQDIIQYCFEKFGLDVFENTNIVNVKSSELGVICYSNNGKKITAKKIIYTTGFDTLRILNINTNLVEYFRTYTITTQSIKDLPEKYKGFVARDTNHPYHYIRFTNDNRLIIGGEDTKLNIEDAKYNSFKNISQEKYLKLHEYMIKLFPVFSDVDIEYETNGIFADTKDSLPIIDEIPNMPNCYTLLGYGANGILYSIIGAKMLTDVCKGFYVKDMKMFKLNRKV